VEGRDAWKDLGDVATLLSFAPTGLCPDGCSCNSREGVPSFAGTRSGITAAAAVPFAPRFLRWVASTLAAEPRRVPWRSRVDIADEDDGARVRPTRAARVTGGGEDVVDSSVLSLLLLSQPSSSPWVRMSVRLPSIQAW